MAEDTETHMRIRVPNALRDKLIVIAEKNGRSLNAEVVTRLEASLQQDTETEALTDALETLWEHIHRLEAKVFEGTGYPWAEDFDPELTKPSQSGRAAKTVKPKVTSKK